MRVVFTIARYELRSLWAGRVLPAAILLLSILLAAGLWRGAAIAREQRQAVALMLDAQQARMASNMARAHEIDDLVAGGGVPFSRWRERSAYFVGWRRGLFAAYLPPAPLAPLAVGQSDLLSTAYFVSTVARWKLFTYPHTANPLMLMAGEYDFAFAIVFLLPLVLIALSFDLIASDREEGTLALALAQGTPLSGLLLGKVVARAAVVLIPVCLILIGGCLLARVDLLSARVWPLALAVTVAVIAYAAFWLALAALINTFGWSGAGNAAVMGAMWAVVVIVLPGLATAVATSGFPIPSRALITTELRDIERGLQKTLVAAPALRKELEGRFFEANPDIAQVPPASGVAASTLRGAAVDREMERRIAPVLAQWQGPRTQQGEFIRSIQVFSPAIQLYYLLPQLSGWSPARFDNFERQVTDYHHRWLVYFLPKIFGERRFTDEDYANIPQFDYQEIPVTQALRDVLPGLGMLSALPVLLLAICLRRCHA